MIVRKPLKPDSSVQIYIVVKTFSFLGVRSQYLLKRSVLPLMHQIQLPFPFQLPQNLSKDEYSGVLMTAGLSYLKAMISREIIASNTVFEYLDNQLQKLVEIA